MAESLELSKFLPFRLNRLAGEMSRRLSAIYGERFGIDVPQWRVLATLGRHEPVTAQAVVHSTRTHKSTISRAVTRLIEIGWVERVRSAEDGREHLLRFTSRGRRAYEEIVPLVLAVEREVLAELGIGGREAVEAALTRLEAALDIPGAGEEMDGT